MVMSVDGYIADLEGISVSTSPDWDEFRKLAKNYNNLVVGRRTYDKGGLNDVDCDFKVVVSSSQIDDKEFIHASSPKDAIAKLRDNVSTVLLVGGGVISNSFLAAKLVDELAVTIQPRVLGCGIRLFSDSSVNVPLQLLSSSSLGYNRVKLIYKVLSNRIG